MEKKLQTFQTPTVCHSFAVLMASWLWTWSPRLLYAHHWTFHSSLSKICACCAWNDILLCEWIHSESSLLDIGSSPVASLKRRRCMFPSWKASFDISDARPNYRAILTPHMSAGSSPQDWRKVGEVSVSANQQRLHIPERRLLAPTKMAQQAMDGVDVRQGHCSQYLTGKVQIYFSQRTKCLIRKELRHRWSAGAI